MSDLDRQTDEDSGALRAVGLGVIVAVGLAGLLIAAYVVGYNRANPDETAAKPEAAPKTKTAKKVDAKALFTEKCGSCHVLEAAATTGAAGPNLDQLKRPAAKVEQQILNGGATMPAGLLEGAEAKEVAEFVAKSTGS